jgi:replicative DNA helicase
MKKTNNLTDIFFKINKKLKKLDSVINIVIIAAYEAMRQNKNKNTSKYPKVHIGKPCFFLLINAI